MTAHEIHKLWLASAKSNGREGVPFEDLSHSEREVWATFAMKLRDAFNPSLTQEANHEPTNPS